MLINFGYSVKRADGWFADYRYDFIVLLSF